MVVKSIFIFIFYIVAGLCLTFSTVQAADNSIKPIHLPPVNSQKIILTIITPSGTKEYTHAQIEAIGLKQMETSTFWPNDDGVYQGVLLKDLLVHAGIANSKKISLTALDNYVTQIPRKDWEKWPVLLATRKAGKGMGIRQKGPTRIIYPKYLGGEIAESEMRIRWVWAVKQIAPEK